jgi:hypothetical protein
VVRSQAIQPSDKAQSAAERMRAYRRRRRHGVRCYEVKLGEAEVNVLVAKGYLSSDKRDDRRAVECAIDGLVFDWLHSQRVTRN